MVFISARYLHKRRITQVSTPSDVLQELSFGILLQDVNDGGYEASVDDRLDLRLSSRRHVGDQPASLFLNVGAVVL